MRYYEAKFCITPYSNDAADLLASLVAEAGFESFDTSGAIVSAYVQTTLFNQPLLDDILNDFPIADTTITYTLSEVADENWNATWEEQGFDPIVIGEECIIYDAKNPASAATLLTDATAGTEEAARPLHIGIEARQAFGTGTHQTTQMMVEMLLETDLKGRRVLDCGCGTGILSIVAARRGAGDVVAYDIDEWSVANCQHNAELNHVTNLTVYEGNSSVLSHVSGLFDVVLANINRNILLSDMPHFSDVILPHGRLILSGFYTEDAPMLAARASEYGLYEARRKVADHWICMEFVKEK